MSPVNAMEELYNYIITNIKYLYIFIFKLYLILKNLTIFSVESINI